jgi:hypothetical protein
MGKGKKTLHQPMARLVRKTLLFSISLAGHHMFTKGGNLSLQTRLFLTMCLRPFPDFFT